MAPLKTDASTACANCNGSMAITLIEPILDDPTSMKHVFTCASCGNSEAFKFLKKGVRPN
jgi:hypothetical protein